MSPLRARLLLSAAWLCLAPAAGAAAGEGSTVAADGSGQYRTVQDAVDAAPQTSSNAAPWTIRIRPGTYHELVYVQREKHFIRLVGENPEKTVITFGLYASMPGRDGRPIGTFRTPTVYVDADDFSAENLTLENSAGPVGQALALRIDGDRVRFRNCRFVGWQDTILANRGRCYFGGCTIQGAVDFIFGAATAYFDRCDIQCLGKGYITAASTPAEQPYGFVFADCSIDGPGDVRTFLGRPWRAFASVLFLNTRMGAVVRPEGWNNWDKPEREKTARYAEFGSTGPGAAAPERAAWSKTLTVAESKAVTVQSVLGGGDGWDPLKP